ncbi:MAG: AraC family transcriptional regulator [Flavobacterium sp.]|nr:AraC family transcriptional regulator [Flavobacterium sp.]
MLINKSIFSDTKGNELRLSRVMQTEQPVKFQNFSVKYVAEGIENYTANCRKFALSRGEYVIGNKHINSSVLIDGQSPAKGICLDVSREVIDEIITCHYTNAARLSHFLFEHEWMAQKYNCTNTQLGLSLQHLSQEFDNLIAGKSVISNEIFFALGERIVCDQSKIFENFSRLKAVKHETNGRIFNFINDAKNYMDLHFIEKLNIEKIAREAKLSEYHFIRLFKTIFKITPYQYIVQKRLHFSLELLQSQYAISDISTMLSYADTAAFSNAFKQEFGFSPKKYKLK